MAGQGELVRVVATQESALLVSRTAAGRGAWLHAGSRPCFELAVRRKAFARSLRRPVPPAALAVLERELFGASGDRREGEPRRVCDAAASEVGDETRRQPGLAP